MTGGGKRLAAVAALTVAGVGLALGAGIGRPDAAQGGAADASQPTGITVNGTGSVEAAPDQAEFSFGVETQGATADEALARNSEAVRAVIAAVEGAGVAAEDVQTQHVSVFPRYREDGQQIVGYTASNTVSAKIRDLAQVGAVVDAAATAGANQIYGPSLSIADQEELYEQALAEAFEDARDKAASIAAAAGVGVGRVLAIVEGGASLPPPIPVAEAAAADEGVPIEPGLQEISASLSVTFAIG